MESSIPPGFRFHPTEEELVGYYLNRKINSLEIDLDVIINIVLYRMEPWDIQDRCRLGCEENNGWYFFSHKDRKYPTDTHTNRATNAGFWKATERYKAVLSKDRIIGMRKTFVFYKGQEPNRRKTDWIMHEFRLQTSELGPPQIPKILIHQDLRGADQLLTHSCYSVEGLECAPVKSIYARLEVLVFMHDVVRSFKLEKDIPNEKIVYYVYPRPVYGLPVRLHTHQES